MRSNEMQKDIRTVLINDWDPVGIGNNSNLSDEYDGYIGPIIQILMQKSSIESIVLYLEKIENEDIGIEHTDIKSLYNIANKLKRIGEKYSEEQY